jgi:hypothetical protein
MILYFTHMTADDYSFMTAPPQEQQAANRFDWGLNP